MLSATIYPAMQPSKIFGAILALFSSTGHGSATYTVGDDRQLIHDHTQLSFVVGPRETPETFIDRVRTHAEPGDVIEFSMRGGAMASAKITRRAAVPLRMEAHETLDTFVQRVKEYKGAMPQA